jgi:hypothetical protein
MAESLIFIENINEIDAIERYVLEDTIVIAMLPSVSIELSRRGIPFENTKSLFGVDGHRETLRRSKLIIEGLRPFLNKINAKGIQHTFEKTWIVYFRIHLIYSLAILFIINKAVQSHHPSKFIIVRNKYKRHNSLGEIVEKYGTSNGINIQYSNKVISNEALVKKDKLIMKWAAKLTFEFQLRLFSIIVNSRNTFLALSDTNNMPRLVERLSKHFGDSFPVYLSIHKKTWTIRMIEMFKGYSFSFLYIPKYIPHSLKVIFQDKYDGCSKEIRRWLCNRNPKVIIYDVDLSHSIMAFVESELKNNMLALYGEIISLNKVLTIVSPRSVFAQHNLGIGYALGETCLKENIPGLLITHGSHTPQTDSLSSYEWSIHAHQMFNSMYPFVAIQTPWAKKFLKKQDGVISKAIDTGPLIYVQPSANIHSKFEMRCRFFGKYNAQKRVILHASSPKSWEALRPWIFETLDEYIDSINTTIKAIEAFPDLYLCIRFRPQKSLSLKEFKMSLVNSNCYDVYSEGSFEEFLMASDLLISYSSTTIEEALQNQIPVLQYDPDGKYEHIKGKILSTDGINSLSTVYSVFAESDLMPALSWWKENHSEDVNRELDWKKHVLENKDNMEWLKIMDIKC